jgi:hypothetical protein
VLDAIEPFFFGGGYDLTIFDERRCGISVVRVYSEDVHFVDVWSQVLLGLRSSIAS